MGLILNVHTLAWVGGVVLLVIIVRDCFNALMVPGRVRRRLRFVPVYFQFTWAAWASVARRIRAQARRERMLSVYGPFAVLCLIALWAAGILVGFGLLQFGLVPDATGSDVPDYLCTSGARIFTLGAEESANSTTLSKGLIIIEAGTGLGLITTVITYLPVLYQLFSRRETHVILLDERAGTPVRASSLICLHSQRNAINRLSVLIASWEQWSAEVLESHVSYPMLSYYRSQHSDESWLAAMAVMMDTCALRIAGADVVDAFQADRTLAMCIKALRNISQVLRITPAKRYGDRLSRTDFFELAEQLRQSGIHIDESGVWERLPCVRDSYEPLLAALADHLLIELPPG